MEDTLTLAEALDELVSAEDRCPCAMGDFQLDGAP